MSHDFLFKRRHFYEPWAPRRGEKVVSALTLPVGIRGAIRPGAATWKDILMPWRDKVMEMINLAAYLAGTKPWRSLTNIQTRPSQPRGGLVIETDVDPVTQTVRHS
jgi:hypothetical protein